MTETNSKLTLNQLGYLATKSGRKMGHTKWKYWYIPLEYAKMKNTKHLPWYFQGKISDISPGNQALFQNVLMFNN